MIKILSIKELKKLTNDGKTEELEILEQENKKITIVEDIGGCKNLKKINLSKNEL